MGEHQERAGGSRTIVASIRRELLAGHGSERLRVGSRLDREEQCARELVRILERLDALRRETAIS